MYKDLVQNMNKIWCTHIKYWHRKSQKDVLTCFGLEDFDECQGWDFEGDNLVFTTRWKFCPICGAEKPK